MRYLDVSERWVFYCHISLHEDRGMMGTVCALAGRSRKSDDAKNPGAFAPGFFML
jgi:hypothetical protein